MNIYIHKYIVLFIDGFFYDLQKFSMYQIPPNNYLSWISTDFYLGWKPKFRREGSNLNVKVIGMLVKKYSNCWRNTPAFPPPPHAKKIQILLKMFWKLLIFTRYGKWADLRNTRISFLHKTFWKTLKKYHNQEFYTLRAYLWLCHGSALSPRGKMNCSYAEALRFVWLRGCSRQVKVKSRKTKENWVSHFRENGPQLSDKGNPYIENILQTGCPRKISRKPWNTNQLLNTHLYGV